MARFVRRIFATLCVNVLFLFFLICVLLYPVCVSCVRESLRTVIQGLTTTTSMCLYNA